MLRTKWKWNWWQWCNRLKWIFRSTRYRYELRLIN